VNEKQPEAYPREADLRARIAAGSLEASDYLDLANLLKAASRFEEAAGIYHEALQRQLPNKQKARLVWELGELLDVAMNRSAEAVTLAREALNLLADESESLDTVLVRGLSHSLIARAVWFRDAEAGRIAARQAIPLLERVIREHDERDDVAMAFSDTAWAYNALGDPDKAIELCQECLRRQPAPRRRLPVLMTLTDALGTVGRFSEAEDAAAQAFQYSSIDPPTRPVLYLTLGANRRRANQLPAALRAFEQARTELQSRPLGRWEPELLRAIYGNLAELYYEGGDFAAAVAMFAHLLSQYSEDSPDHPRILNWLGRCHEARGSYAEARQHYQQVIASPVVSDEDRGDAQEGLAALPSSP
jgi:tetratricopeptide (TPR) repeat protein